MRPRVSRLRPPRVVAAGLLRTTPNPLKTMNIHHLIGEILEELKTLREENALLGHEVAALHAKLFNMFKEITDAARNNIGRHIYPILEGGRASDTDAVLADLYEEWQAGCRAAAAGLQRSLYPNEELPMPQMPVDDEEHQPCRQMAAVLIERTVYDENTARAGFENATQSILNSPACANHPKSCACHQALEGWKHYGNKEQVELLTSFYKAHYDREKDEGYLQAVRDLAHHYGITFEQMLERERAQKAEWEAADQRAAAREAAKAEERKKWVFICYQDCGPEIEKYNDGKCMHGFYRVVKTAECYEFTLMECDLWHPDWQEAARDHAVWRFPLDMPMGKRSTAFESVTPDKIQMS